MTNKFDVSKPDYWDWKAVKGNAAPVIKIMDAYYHQETLDVVTGKVIIVGEAYQHIPDWGEE